MVEGTSTFDWAGLLVDQVDWHWQHQARPRLAGLSDEEYRWEPVPGAWNVRPRGSGAPAGAVEVGSGAGVIDYAFPEPAPAPVTTIGWRLCHVVVGVLAERNGRYFAGPPASYDAYDYPLTAAAALAALDDGYARWIDGVRALGEAGLRDRCREPGFEKDSMAGLVLHINRELIHHLAEVALLRDLWAHGKR
jgi:DinB superfamily